MTTAFRVSECDGYRIDEHLSSDLGVEKEVGALRNAGYSGGCPFVCLGG